MSPIQFNSFDQNSICADQLSGFIEHKKNTVDQYKIKIADYLFVGKEEIVRSNFGGKAICVKRNSKKYEIILSIFDENTRSWRNMSVDHRAIAKKLKIKKRTVIELVEKGNLEQAINANQLSLEFFSVLEKTISGLFELHIKYKNYEKIVSYYQKNITKLLCKEEPIHIKKNESHLSNNYLYSRRKQKRVIYKN